MKTGGQTWADKNRASTGDDDCLESRMEVSNELQSVTCLDSQPAATRQCSQPGPHYHLALQSTTDQTTRSCSTLITYRLVRRIWTASPHGCTCAGLQSQPVSLSKTCSYRYSQGVTLTGTGRREWKDLGHLRLHLKSFMAPCVSSCQVVRLHGSTSWSAYSMSE